MLNKKETNRGVNYDDWEIVILLDSITKILPLGGNDWEKVASLHNSSVNKYRIQHGLENVLPRAGSSLKAKFVKLSNTPKSTGILSYSLFVSLLFSFYYY